MAIILTILCGTFTGFLAWCFIHRFQQWGKPGLKTWPILGAAVEVSANYHRIYDWILWNLVELNCKSFVVPMPTHCFVFTADPANVEHILKRNFSNYPKGDFFRERFETLLGHGIFNSDGDEWKSQRKTASFEFASRMLRDFSIDLFKDSALRLASIIESFASKGETLDIQEFLMRMTMDAICKIGFGVNIGVLSPTFPENHFAKAFDKSNQIISYRFADPLWKIKRILKIGQEGALKKYVEILDTFTHGIINKRRTQLQHCEEKDAKHNDILSRFMSLDLGLSDANLRDVVLNFMIAGRDTTASTLSWFFYRLATHPHVASNIRKELQESQFTTIERENAMQKFSELLTYDCLTKLPYLHAAIMETLRLHPAVPLNFKSVVQPDLLPDGTSVKNGDIIGYSPWCMGRLKSIWGPDAAEFRPERWCKNGNWDFNVSPFKFTAFQAGPRICLGKESAYLQMKIAAAILCRFFSFSLAPNQTITYNVMATMPIANGLKVHCKILL